jgi:hypothetical protein
LAAISINYISKKNENPSLRKILPHPTGNLFPLILRLLSFSGIQKGDIRATGVQAGRLGTAKQTSRPSYCYFNLYYFMLPEVTDGMPYKETTVRDSSNVDYHDCTIWTYIGPETVPTTPTTRKAHITTTLISKDTGPEGPALG